MEWPYTLKRSIEAGGRTTTHVTFRDATFKDFKLLSKRMQEGDEIEAISLSIADLAGMNVAEVDKLSPEDSAELMARVNEAFAPFEKLARSKSRN